MLYFILRWSCLSVLVVAPAVAEGAETPLSKLELVKLGKSATAVVERKNEKGWGTAFCIHPSGWFVTDEKWLEKDRGPVTLVLHPGTRAEKAFPARVVHSDRELGLALLRAEGVADLTALPLGSADRVVEKANVVTCGYPHLSVAPLVEKDYPSIIITNPTVTVVSRNEREPQLIRLNMTFGPGQSGGPVLDGDGKVVGVILVRPEGFEAPGPNSVVTVNRLARFLAKSQIDLTPRK